jgi:hypothetical protein
MGSDEWLGALAKSETTSTPASYSYTTNGNGGITENEYVAVGNAAANAEWWDSMAVNGTPNANGFVSSCQGAAGTDTT